MENRNGTSTLVSFQPTEWEENKLEGTVQEDGAGIWIYRRVESGLRAFEVGFFSPIGEWISESGWFSREDAAERVHWLNGGSS